MSQYRRPSMTFAALAVALMLPGLAWAQTPRIDQRQANQEQRIDQGVKSGELTRRETRRLEREQAAIEKGETRAQADGKVTKKERARLTRAQDRASRDIARQKHDAQDRN